MWRDHQGSVVALAELCGFLIFTPDGAIIGFAFLEVESLMCDLQEDG